MTAHVSRDERAMIIPWDANYPLGRDPQWAKPAKWETDNTIPATESHVGEGAPAADEPTATTTAPTPATGDRVPGTEAHTAAPAAQ